MCVVDDVEVHEKFSRLKDGKYTKINTTMNAFSLTLSSPIFGCCVVVQLSGAVCALLEELRMSEREGERERLVFERVKLIGFLIP